MAGNPNPFMANPGNKPVGSAGQPQSGKGGKPTFHGAIKKEVPESKKGAIERRMKKRKATKK